MYAVSLKDIHPRASHHEISITFFYEAQRPIQNKHIAFYEVQYANILFMYSFHVSRLATLFSYVIFPYENIGHGLLLSAKIIYYDTVRIFLSF